MHIEMSSYSPPVVGANASNPNARTCPYVPRHQCQWMRASFFGRSPHIYLPPCWLRNVECGKRRAGGGTRNAECGMRDAESEFGRAPIYIAFIHPSLFVPPSCLHSMPGHAHPPMPMPLPWSARPPRSPSVCSPAPPHVA